MRLLARIAAFVAVLACSTAAARAATTTWVVLSDIHYDPYAHFNIRDGDTSPQLWSLTLTSLRAQHNADVVVVDGDQLAHHFANDVRANDPGHSPQAEGARVTAMLAHDLGAVFPRARFIVTLGNNDDPCGDYRSETTGPYAAQLAAIWEPLVARGVPNSDFTRAFADGGYYASDVPGGRVLALNTVLWSFVWQGSCATDRRDVAQAELSWLKNSLRASKQPTALVMHIPPGYDPTSTTLAKNFFAVPFLRSDRSAALARIVESAGDRVTFGVASHAHRYGFRVLDNVAILMAPPVSPIYHNFPAYTVMRVDDRLHVRSIVPYVYDPEVQRFTARESFAQTYRTSAFDGANLRAAAARVWSDPEARARWIAAYDLWTPRMGDIADHDWRFFICASTDTDGGYAACTHSTRLAAAPWIVALATTSVVATLVVILVLVRRRRLRPRS